MMFNKILAVAVLSLIPAGAGFAATYFVAPIGAAQSCAADGSRACPWPSLDAALSSGVVTGGDVINLMNGDHGAATLRNRSFTTPVIIRALNPHKAHVDSIAIQDGTSRVTFRNLNVWPSDPHNPPGALLSVSPNASHIVFDGIDARAGKDALNYLSWSATEWQNRAVDGAFITGSNTQLTNSRFTGIRFGISFLGANNTARGNIIDGFSGDGLRGQGKNSHFIRNTVTNCVSVDDNHADGFQAFTDPSHPISGIVLDGNTIIEWTHNMNAPLRCTLQGVGMFDGYYDNFSIRNNLVIGRHPHGISVYGGRHGTIVNNTVSSITDLPDKYPWIGIFPLKNGALSQDVTVANNLAMSYNGQGASVANGIRLVKNATIPNPATAFQDVGSYNYLPQAGSGFIDAATATYAPKTDILGGARPAGPAPDLGAFEVGATGGATQGSMTTVPGTAILKWGSFVTP